MSISKIEFIPGFMGTYEDFFSLIAYLKKDFFCLPFDGAKKDCCLVGYSMGGRRCLQFFPFAKKAVIISAHPGIEDPHELEKRKKWEENWMRLLNEHSVEEFLTLWYNQPIFATLKKHPSFPAMLERRKTLEKQQIAYFFSAFSITRQPPLWDALFHYPIPLLFLFGSLDKKYKKIHQRIKKIGGQVQSKLLLNAGHALHLECPERCAYEIKSFINS